MKKQLTSLGLAVAISALLGTIVMAKSHTITFNEDTIVNGTLVKKGEYRAKFDEETGQFVIKELDNDVVVTAKAKEQPLNRKSDHTTFETTRGEGGVAMLKSVTFHGKRMSIVMEDNNQTISEENVEIFSDLF